VVAASLLGIVTWGTLVGSMLPFLIRRLGFDPASASAPFVATVVDVSGLIIYFEVALVLLRVPSCSRLPRRYPGVGAECSASQRVRSCCRTNPSSRPSSTMGNCSTSRLASSSSACSAGALGGSARSSARGVTASRTGGRAHALEQGIDSLSLNPDSFLVVKQRIAALEKKLAGRA
jgi:hypothetical protein